MHSSSQNNHQNNNHQNNHQNNGPSPVLATGPPVPAHPSFPVMPSPTPASTVWVLQPEQSLQLDFCDHFYFLMMH